jgi:hypothetical protein
MPDASGNFKGISVPSLPKSMEGKTSKDSPESVRSDLTAWNEAKQAAILREFQKETRWAGTD